MRRRAGLMGLHLEPRERARSPRPDRPVPPADQLALRAADAQMSERAATRLRIPVGEGCEDLPQPFVRHPPAEVAWPAVQSAYGVSRSRFGHGYAPLVHWAQLRLSR